MIKELIKRNTQRVQEIYEGSAPDLSFLSHRIHSGAKAGLLSLATVSSLFVTTTIEAQENLTIVNPELQQQIESLEERSGTFRQYIEDIRNGPVKVVIGSHEDFPEMKRKGAGQVDLSWFVKGNTIYASSAKVAIDLSQPEEIFKNQYFFLPNTETQKRAIEGEKAALIAHEVIHIGSISKAGGATNALCRDPRKGEDPLDSCVIKLENQIRSELGIPLTKHYGWTQSAVEKLLGEYREILRGERRVETLVRQDKYAKKIAEPTNTAPRIKR